MTTVACAHGRRGLSLLTSSLTRRLGSSQVSACVSRQWLPLQTDFLVELPPRHNIFSTLPSRGDPIRLLRRPIKCRVHSKWNVSKLLLSASHQSSITPSITVHRSDPDPSVFGVDDFQVSPLMVLHVAIRWRRPPPRIRPRQREQSSPPTFLCRSFVKYSHNSHYSHYFHYFH